MIPIRVAALAACALVALAAAPSARAAGATGWRFDGAAELGAFAPTGLTGALGFDAAYVQAHERDVHTEYQLVYRHVEDAGMTMTVPEEYREAPNGDLIVMLVAADLRGVVRGHTSPFLRAGIGAGLAHAGATRTSVMDATGWHPSVTPGRTAPGLAGRLALGFGRLPSEGLGFEVSFGLFAFAGHESSYGAFGMSFGLVH